MKFLILATFTLYSCSTTPTGRTQLKLVSASQMNTLGDDSYAKLKKETPIDNNPKNIQYVKCITDRLLTVIGENPKEWEVNIFKDETLNAFALPGKNIGVHTGMLNFAKTQDQLAAVIGHEIGHVLAEHGNERVSQSMLIGGGLQIADLVIGRNENNSRYILAGLGLGAQFGVLMPFGRKHESEADLLGLEYMAKAGFNPEGAIELWKLMSKNAGKSPPEFLSTHPSHNTRIELLSKAKTKYMGIYQNVKNKPLCIR